MSAAEIIYMILYSLHVTSITSVLRSPRYHLNLRCSVLAWVILAFMRALFVVHVCLGLPTKNDISRSPLSLYLPIDSPIWGHESSRVFKIPFQVQVISYISLHWAPVSEMYRIIHWGLFLINKVKRKTVGFVLTYQRECPTSMIHALWCMFWHHLCSRWRWISCSCKSCW